MGGTVTLAHDMLHMLDAAHCMWQSHNRRLVLLIERKPVQQLADHQ